MSTHVHQHNAGAQRSPWVLIPPPPLFVAAFLAGVAFNHVVALALLPKSLRGAEQAAGVALIAAAVLMAIGAVALFIMRRTTIIPHGQARTLIMRGPYRFTRNPMYLGLTSAYVGMALLLNLLWPLVFLMLPIWVLQTRTIPFEEAQLTEIFGAQYRDYQRRVRRWI